MKRLRVGISYVPFMKTIECCSWRIYIHKWILWDEEKGSTLHMKDLQIEPNSPTPIYEQIAQWMIENIRTGKWKKGYQLQAEEDLAKVIQVSRGTLRKAISVLIEQGLLLRMQGKGTFVQEEKISYPFAQQLISFAESMDARGYAYKTSVIDQKVELPNKIIQQQLAIDPTDAVLYLKRVRSIQDEPAILLENWVVVKRCPGIEQEDFQQVSLFNAIENHANVQISYGVRNFGALSLNKGQAQLLNVRPEVPVLTLEQVTYSAEEEPLECSRVLLRTDKYEITSVLTR